MNDIVKLIEEKEKRKKRTLEDFLLDFFDIVSFIIFIVGVVSFVRFFLFNPYTVVGQSMEPTFSNKDFIIVDKITPRFGELHRGDVIVFVPPEKDVPYIKRIIGLPGDKIKINEGKVFLCKESQSGESCEMMEEGYLDKGVRTNVCPTGKIDEFYVTSGTYLVFGDNRENSTDSRCCFGFGCSSGNDYLVPEKYIIGKVYVKIFPEFEKF